MQRTTMGWGIVIIAVVALLIGLANRLGGPTRSSPDVTLEDAGEEAREAADTTYQAVTAPVRTAVEATEARLQEEQKTAYEESVEERLEAAAQRLQDLQARAEAAESPEARTEVDAIIEQLQRHVAAVRQELNALKMASADAWQDKKAHLDRAMQDLERTLSQSLAGTPESVSAS